MSIPRKKTFKKSLLDYRFRISLVCVMATIRFGIAHRLYASMIVPRNFSIIAFRSRDTTLSNFQVSVNPGRFGVCPVENCEKTNYKLPPTRLERVTYCLGGRHSTCIGDLESV